MPDKTYYPCVYVRYQDHHWLGEEVLKDLLDAEDTGVNQGMVEEVGFLIKKTDDYIILAIGIQRPVDPIDDDGMTRFIYPTKLLRRDIVKMKFLKIPRPK